MSKSGKSETDELKELFASPARPISPARESALPLTRIAKFGVADENSRLASQGRMEKEERLRQREVDAMNRLAKAHAKRDEIFETNARAKLHQDLTKEKNQNLVRSIRATEAEWQVEREQAHENFRADARKRVLIANALDARLDAQEEAVDQQERLEGTNERTRVLHQVEEVRQQKLQENRAAASYVREKTAHAVREAEELAALTKKRAAQTKRNDSEIWKQEKQEHDKEQLTRAAVGKQAVGARPAPLCRTSRPLPPHHHLPVACLRVLPLPRRPLPRRPRPCSPRPRRPRPRRPRPRTLATRAPAPSHSTLDAPWRCTPCRPL